MQRRFRQAFTELNSRFSILGSFSNLDQILIKATSHDDFPIPEKYIHDLLKFLSISPSSSFRSFSLSFTHRFGKTRSWRVALKCLLLLHRLLRSLPQTSPFRSDLLWSRSNGLLSLYPCRFHDNSASSGSEDFTMFIASYARLLDEALDCFSIDFDSTPKEMDNSTEENFVEKMKEIGRVLDELTQLQSLIDRVMECEPIGVPSKTFLIRSAMKQIVRDSFVCYTTIRRGLVLLLDNLFQMQYRNCIYAFGIYKRAALQASRLSEFYDFCKSKGYCGAYEYPFIDRIPHIHVRALESFLNGMWQLTDSESETESSEEMSSITSSSLNTPSTLTGDESERQQLVLGQRLKTVVSTEWERFEEEQEEKPLIQLETEDETLIKLDIEINHASASWEKILEASAELLTRENMLFNRHYYGYRGGNAREKYWDEPMSIQVYNPNNSSVNPFYRRHHIGLNHYGGSEEKDYTYRNPYPWGL